MKFIKDNIIKYGETLILSDFLRLEEDVDGRVSIRAVVGSGSGMVLDDLADVTISSPAVDQFLRYNGSLWVNQLITAGNVGSGTFKSGGFAFTGPVVLGNDPGGTKMLRVSGSANFGFNQSVAFGDVTIVAQDPVYHRVGRRDGGTGIFLGGAGDQGNYYDNDSHHWRLSTGFGSEKMLLSSSVLMVSGVSNINLGTNAGLGGYLTVGGGTTLAIDFTASGRIDHKYYDTAAALDEKRWDISVDGVSGPQSFTFVTRTDAGVAGTSWLRALNRSGTSVGTTELRSSSASVILTTSASISTASGGNLTLNTTGGTTITGSSAELAMGPRTGAGTWELYNPTGADFRFYYSGDKFVIMSSGIAPASTGLLTLGTSGLRWGKYWGADADFTGDIKVGTNLGTFDSSSVATTDHVLSYNGTKWVSRLLQSSFSNGQVTASQLSDLTFASFVHDGRTPTGSPTAPTSIQDPVTTALYRAILVDVSAYGALPADKVFVIDYSINGGGFSTNAIVCTSNKVVHSNLNSANTYSYKYKIRGASDSAYSDATTALNPSNNSEVNAFGVILASQIAAANISAISVNIGDIAAGQVRNPANTAGILFSGTLPGTWTTYMNLVATGMNPVFHHPGLDLLANGSAIFSGVVTAGYITMGSGISLSNFAIGTPLISDDGFSDATASASIERGRYISQQQGNGSHISFDSRSSDVHLKMRIKDTPNTYFRLITAGSADLYLQAADTSFGLTNNVIFKLAGGIDIASGTTSVAGDLYNPLVVHSGSGTKIIDWREGNVQKFILKAAGQTIKLDNGNLGGVYTLLLFQDAVGGRTVTTWTTDDVTTDVKWPANVAPTLSTTANAADVVTFVKTLGSGTTNHYFGMTGGFNYSG